MPHGPFGSPQRPQPPPAGNADDRAEAGDANALNFRVTFAFPQCGQRAVRWSSAERKSSSNSRPHDSHVNSNIGISITLQPKREAV